MVTRKPHFNVYIYINTNRLTVKWIFRSMMHTFTTMLHQVRTLNGKTGGHMEFWLAEKSKVCFLRVHVIIHKKILQLTINTDLFRCMKKILFTCKYILMVANSSLTLSCKYQFYLISVHISFINVLNQYAYQLH